MAIPTQSLTLPKIEISAIPGAGGTAGQGLNIASGTPASSLGGGLGGVLGGAAAVSAAGSVVPILGNILGAAGGAVVGGIFSLISADMQNKEMRRQQEEAQKQAKQQFEWGKTVDVFNMEQERAKNDNAIAQDRMSQLRAKISADAALQDRLKTQFSFRR
jgi:gas vesicle protein